MKNEILNLTLARTRDAVLNGEIKAHEVVDFYVERIKKHDGVIKSFLSVDEDAARKKAEEIDEKIMDGGKIGRLAGCVIAIKDNINILGSPTTCGSKILEGYVSPYDATVISRMRDEDAIFVGKTNLDEFAMGSSTENSAFFATKNPWDKDRVPGGSSGGSAAAVAAGFTSTALGSDTGGSIRQPAAFCGVVGVKPTYGLVSRYGLVAFASSLDQIGPFSRNVEDSAVILDVISGKDRMDSTTFAQDIEGLDPLAAVDIRNIKIGLPEEYFSGGVDDEILSAIENLMRMLESYGVKLKKISLPHTKYCVAAYYIVAPSEASSNLARFDGVKYGLMKDAENLLSMYIETREKGFGPEVKRRLMLGTYALSSGYYDAYYLAAQKVRTLISDDFSRAFKGVDFIISPATPTVAFRFGEKISAPLSMYLSDIFTISANLAGIPAMSMPIGFGKKTPMPIGMQIMAPHFSDGKMLSFAKFVEDLVKFAGKEPNL